MQTFYSDYLPRQNNFMFSHTRESLKLFLFSQYPVSVKTRKNKFTLFLKPEKFEKNKSKPFPKPGNYEKK
jgi:hypothetical protein